MQTCYLCYSSDDTSVIECRLNLVSGSVAILLEKDQIPLQLDAA